MNSASLVRFPRRQQAQGAQGRRSVAAAAAADRADGGGQYHGMYVAKDAVAKLACLCCACLCSARPRVCLRGVCCERDSPAPVCRASACLSGQDSSLCVSCVVSCVRCELLAVRAQEPWRVCRLGDVTYTRFAQLGLRLRGSVRFEVRGRRVCLWLRPLYCLSLCVFYVCLLTY